MFARNRRILEKAARAEVAGLEDNGRVQPSGNRWKAPQASITQLDAGSVSLECGEGLERSADGAPEPEAARLGDDYRIPAGDADLEVADAIAEGLANLALDPSLGDELGIGLGFAVWAGRIPGRRWWRFARRLRLRESEEATEYAGRSARRGRSFLLQGPIGHPGAGSPSGDGTWGRGPGRVPLGGR